MTQQLISDQLTVSFKALGAELYSVKNKNNLEFIWQANPNIWPRHAPVLFPIVGKLKNNQYQLNQNVYQMGQHGFARDMVFDLVEQTPNTILFRLNDNDISKKNYPFDFVFDVQYTLVENELDTSYTISNKGNSPMFFSVGAHPGFRIPLLPDEHFEDYVLSFNKENLNRHLLIQGHLSGKTDTLLLPQKALALSSQLFDEDALVFENSQIDEISLFSRKSAHKITLICKNWPFFGIWSKKSCNEFICLEPWYGIADSLDVSGELHEKKGIIALAGKESFSASYQLRFQ